jgi:hypothetical protein
MTSHKRLLTAIVTGAVALTGLAAGAGAASAAPAVFSYTSDSSLWISTTKLTFTVTNTGTGVVTKTLSCGNNSSGGAYGSGGAISNSGSPLQGHIVTSDFAPWLICSDTVGGTYKGLLTPQQLNAEKSGTTFSLTSPVSLKAAFMPVGGSSPAVIYTNGPPNVAFSGTWTNGTASAPFTATSRVVFSNTLVGYDNPWTAIRLTGTLYIGADALQLS